MSPNKGYLFVPKKNTTSICIAPQYELPSLMCLNIDCLYCMSPTNMTKNYLNVPQCELPVYPSIGATCLSIRTTSVFLSMG